VLVGLFLRAEDGLSITNVRTVEVGETFYFFVPEATYTLFAFADDNGDFTYQRGEPAVRIDNPLINQLENIDQTERLDFETLRQQSIVLSKNVVLEQKLNLSVKALRERSDVGANFLGVVAWEDERFSVENIKRGMWQPGDFQDHIGYGLYLLKEFDPDRKSIVLVHGIMDSPPTFRPLVERLPAAYQILLFHYPSGFPLEHSAYMLTVALEELLRRYPLSQLDVIAHSMGGLVSHGMLNQLDAKLRPRIRNYVSLATPFGGHPGAESGIRWAPTVAPVWWAMAPNSAYLRSISDLDLAEGPNHHLVFTFSHARGGESRGDDGVVSVKSQLDPSAQRNAIGIYGIADDHKGVIDNDCTTALLAAILADGVSKVVFPGC